MPLTYVKVQVNEAGKISPYTLFTSYTNASFLVGFRYFEEEAYEDCTKHLEEALESQDASRADLLKAYLFLGISYVAKDAQTKALEQFRKVLRLDPKCSLDEVNFSPKIRKVFDQAKRSTRVM